MYTLPLNQVCCTNHGMLNPFPELLTYSFFAPLLLRVAVGILFAVAGWRHLVSARALYSQTMRSRFGPRGVMLLWHVGALELLVAAGLIIGFFTQIGAIGGMVLAASFWWRGNENPLATYAASTYALAGIICAATLLTGAGAIAVDLPL